MAEKEDKGLIGFDPLAWMNEEVADNDAAENPGETKAEVIVKDEQVANNVAIANDTVEEASATTAELEPTVEESKESNNGSTVTLNATLNIQGIGALHEEFLKLLETEDIFEIDASDVTSVDTSTLQLLAVLKQTASKLGKEVVIDFPSDKFIEAAELLGLSEILGLDQASSGFF